MASDYPDFQAPQAHADTIAATGVPLLRGANVLGGALGSTVIGGNGSQLLTSMTVTQPSWELAVLPNLPAAAGTAPFVLITMIWQDLSTPTFFATKKIVLLASNGNGAGLTEFGITGPSLGDLLTVNIQNLDPAQTLTYTWSMSQTSHTFSKIEVYQQGYNNPAPVGFTYPAGDPQTNVIANFQASIGAGNTAQRLLAIAPGKWTVSLASPSANAVDLSMQLVSGVSIGAGNEVFAMTANNNRVRDEFKAPYEPVLVAMTNNGAAAVTPRLGIIRSDY